LQDNQDDLGAHGPGTGRSGAECFPFLNNAIIAVAAPSHPLGQQSHSRCELKTMCRAARRDPARGRGKACDGLFVQRRVHVAGKTCRWARAKAWYKAQAQGWGIKPGIEHLPAAFLRNAIWCAWISANCALVSQLRARVHARASG